MVKDYDGIGFLITDGIFVIDCDNCRNTENILTPTVYEIVNIFPDCYMEWSPSGNGLHIIGYAPNFYFDKQQYWMNNRSLNVEVYISGATNRFMALTGNVLQKGSLPDKTPELQGFLERFMCRNKDKTPLTTEVKSLLDDDTVITKATYARNGTTFKKLWSGDCSGYASQSEADLALAGILAFWTGKDLSQMDRLFRRSGLFREKWDRKQSGSTYGYITLGKAISDTRDVYHPPKRNAIPNGDGKPNLHKFKPEDNDRYCWADIGSGRLFGDYFKEVARFVPERKLWYCFDGKRWIPDLSALRVMEFCKTLADELLQYSHTIEDEKKKTSYMAYCLKWQRRVFRETIIKEAQSIYPIAMENFDTDIYAFNCQNETLHLNTKITVIIHQRMWQGWLEFVSPIYQNLAVDLYSMLLR